VSEAEANAGPAGGSVGEPGPEEGTEWRGDVRVRPMTGRDLAAVMEIERSSFTMPWTEETFRGLLRRADSLLWVAESEAGVVVGYAAVWMVLDQAELGDIAVAEGWRRRGIGRRLLETTLAAMAERSVRELYLEVRPSKREARRLYEQYGFEEVGRRKDYYGRPREDALVLRRQFES
jgi:[ribosomal protein S18]-alanine N-acetyltransferase